MQHSVNPTECWDCWQSEKVPFCIMNRHRKQANGATAYNMSSLLYTGAYWQPASCDPPAPADHFPCFIKRKLPTYILWALPPPAVVQIVAARIGDDFVQCFVPGIRRRTELQKKKRKN